ncbi:uracil-DNA glycosylase [Candidatus Uhrbacteria bacterium CG10_big_fil_rev_8_21_14_0_10_50_16]|uniref:Type-4 uracil-DNA glycosylase n=1 Tax=Candidatus Uhrbacteria bacterium CG10_big_fil_rev_8_21_14_0_10_50_16 TaxID=1975039 RepID=A0A2H0RNL8_9BACT|nr:MAG: uracil-DNA glycosylase [Candidatus Uhrbacteria bacterium CG10_big_fil_rev_8_21_14_0_10_50_16]
MEVIHREIECLTASFLCEERIRTQMLPVIGEGSLDARVMFIGEAPGKKEALTGKPFCGASGKVLDQLLTDTGLSRESVYITNVVKDRPPKNRDPKPEEIELYGPFLDRQIALIQPTVIATLGRFSMEYVMRRYGLEERLETISGLHGKQHTLKMEFGTVHMRPLYHPAVAVYNRTRYSELLADMQSLADFEQPAT